MNITKNAPIKNAHLLDDNSLGVGGTLERVRLKRSAQVLLLVDLAGPFLLATMVLELTRRLDTARLTTHRE